MFVDIAKGMKTKNNYEYYQASDPDTMYPAPGDCIDYLYENLGVLAYCIEVGSEEDGFVPENSKVEGICSSNVEASKYLIDQVIKKNLRTAKYKRWGFLFSILYLLNEVKEAKTLGLLCPGVF